MFWAVGLLYSLCHDAAVLNSPWALAFLIPGSRLTVASIEKTRAQGQINYWNTFHVSALMWCLLHPLISHWPQQVAWSSWKSIGYYSFPFSESPSRKGMYYSLTGERADDWGQNRIYYSWWWLLTSSASKFLCTFLFTAIFCEEFGGEPILVHWYVLYFR